MGNPFTDTSSDLLVLDRQEVRNAGVIDSVSNLKELGERQCSEFFNCRLVQHTTPVTDRIPRNNVPLFRLRPDKAKNPYTEQLLAIKRDWHLFSTVYIASQVRDADLPT